MDIRIIAAAFVCGICIADRVGFTNILFITLGILTVCLVRLCFKRKVLLIIPVAALVFSLGASEYKMMTLDELNTSYKYMSDTVTVSGYISDVPYETNGVMKYTLRAKRISSDSGDEGINEKFIVYSKENFEYGTGVSFSGVLKNLPKKMNESGFDTAMYYKSCGVSGRMNAEAAGEIKELSKSFSIIDIPTNIRYSICNLIDKYYTGDRAGAMKAVIAGKRYEFSDEMNNILTRTAARRLFYPAYIHMMLLNMLVGCMASVINRRKRDILTAILFILYMLVNIHYASFVRTFSCAAASALSVRFFKRKYYPDILACVLLITTALNPFILFNAGYVTSVVGAILVRIFYRPMADKANILNGSYVKRIITVGLICTIGMLPLTAYYYNSISVYSVFASVIFFPVVVCVLIAAPLFLLMLKIFGTAPIVGQFMTTMTSIMLAVPKIMDKLPLSRIYIKTPSLIFIAAHFMLIAALAYIIKKKSIRARQFAALAAALFTICALRYISRINTVEVDFVNVGQGDGAAVSMPLGPNLLIDGGGSGEYSSYNTGERIYLPYLIDKGITTVDAAFVSHYHKDHAEGIAAALDNLKVKNIFMPESMIDGEWRRILVDKALTNGSKIWFVSNNMEIEFNNGLTVEITVPDSETRLSKEENDTSLLINVSYGKFNCLFTGDMTMTAEKNLLRKDKVPSAEVLKIAHHGSKKSTSEEFFKAVSPDYSVISLGENNMYGFPNKEVLEHIQDSEILRTDINGDIRVISDKKGNIKIHTFR